jgi:succinate-semialdehyde dehydrogenase/glutarate-semialdehyde dehydrogenase
VVLECGGKDPMIVFADADLDKAAEDAVTFSLSNCGQVCCAVERIYVDESVKDAFAEKVVKIAGGWTAGDGLDESVTMGPLVSELQRTTVHKHVRAAVAAGATCALGGEMPPADKPGTFYPPTVLVDVPHKGCPEITQEETFGPVVAISSFGGAEDVAVALSNDCESHKSAVVSIHPSIHPHLATPEVQFTLSNQATNTTLVPSIHIFAL